MPSKELGLVISELNLLARNHPIAELREIRHRLKGLTKLPPKDIFTKRSTKDHYAFHDGGRKELQFNIGIDNDQIRFGIAFSFEPSQSFTNIDVLFPKVRLFNEFLQLYPEKYADMRMWYSKKYEERSADYMPTSIPHELAAKNYFVFLGKRQPYDRRDYKFILDEMYRLLPLYQFVESEGNKLPFSSGIKATFEFRSGFTTAKKSSAVITQSQREIDMLLRHNTLQEELCLKLSEKYGIENVGDENTNGIGNRVDVMVRQKDEFWFYEIKTSNSPRICLRQAIGQLLEYAFWPGFRNVTRLIVVGETELDDEGRKYLDALKKRFSLPIEYQQIVINKKQ